MEAVHVPAHLAPPGSLQAKQPATLTLSSHWNRAATAKKKKIFKSCVHACRVALVPSASLRPWRLWPARLLCRRGGTPGKNTGVFLANTGCHTHQSTVFPAALAANPPEYLVLPEPLRPKQLHHFHTWPSQGQTQALQASLRN